MTAIEKKLKDAYIFAWIVMGSLLLEIVLVFLIVVVGSCAKPTLDCNEWIKEFKEVIKYYNKFN